MKKQTNSFATDSKSCFMQNQKIKLSPRTTKFIKFFLCFICIFKFSFLILSCGASGSFSGFFYSDNQPDNRIDSNLKKLSVSFPSAKTYTFLIFSDLHFGVKPENNLPYTQMEASISAETSAGRAPIFIVTLGDQTNSGTQDEYEQFQSFMNYILSKTGIIQTFGVIGNHDLWNGGKNRWTNYVSPGATFYWFSQDSWNRSFYFLDSASGTLGSKQLESLEKALSADKKRKFLFMHYPVASHEDTAYFMLADSREKIKILSLADKNDVDLLFVGHYHEARFDEIGSFAQVIAGSLKKNSKGFCYWTFVTINEDLQTATFRRYSIENNNENPVLTEWTYCFIH